MCDYSLHDVNSRKAAEQDDLILGKFGQYRVTGFGRAEDGSQCVTCIPHGTALLVAGVDGQFREAIFGHNDNGLWRDGLIFADAPNAVTSLQEMKLGTKAKVVKLALEKAPELPRAGTRQFEVQY